MSSAPAELQTNPKTTLHVMWFETKTGIRYEFPDMLESHITQAHRNLTMDLDFVAANNLSEAALLIPKRILKRAGVGDRCFWEAI